MKRLVFCLVPLLFANKALAEAAFQFTAPNLRAPEDPEVDGVRVSLFQGKNTSVRGFDLGILSPSESSRWASAHSERPRGSKGGGANVQV